MKGENIPYDGYVNGSDFDTNDQRHGGGSGENKSYREYHDSTNDYSYDDGSNYGNGSGVFEDNGQNWLSEFFKQNYICTNSSKNIPQEEPQQQPGL
jgi:hypothetical protein